jgi:hypothetical protein
LHISLPPILAKENLEGKNLSNIFWVFKEILSVRGGFACHSRMTLHSRLRVAAEDMPALLPEPGRSERGIDGSNYPPVECLTEKKGDF